MSDTEHRFKIALRENRTLIQALRLMFLVLALGWLGYSLFAHSLIESMFKGESFAFLNRIIVDQELSSLEHYFQKADQLFLALNLYVIIVFTLGAVIVTKHDVVFGNRVVFVILSLVVLVGMSFIKPVIRGDAPGYFLMTESWFNHLSPDLQERDRESAIAKLGDQFDPKIFQKNTPRDYYFPAKDGRFYELHFWAYPLFNLPMKSVLHLIRANEARTLQITNAILFIVALFHVIFIAPWPGLEKRLFMFLLLFSPVFWFLCWPHPEVFSCSFVVMSLVYMSRKTWPGAVLCSAIAGMQNGPILFLVAFMWLNGMARSGRRWRDLFVLSACAVPVTAPYLFNWIKYGAPTLLGAGSSHLSVFKAFELFFDFNIGMLPYVPLAVLTFFVIIVRDVIRRRVALSAQFFVVLLAMMFGCTSIQLWNHGTTGPSRYVIWMLPLVFYIVVREVGRAGVRRSVYVTLVWVAVVMQALIVFRGKGFQSTLNHNRHTYLAAFVLDHFPALYNPSPQIFAGRTTHRLPRFTRTDSGFKLGEPSTPVVYRYKGKCRKAMVRGRDREALESLCGPVSKSHVAFFEDPANAKRTIYINY